VSGSLGQCFRDRAIVERRGYVPISCGVVELEPKSTHPWCLETMLHRHLFRPFQAPHWFRATSFDWLDTVVVVVISISQVEYDTMPSSSAM